MWAQIAVIALVVEKTLTIGVALPRTRTRGVGVSTPQVDHRPAVDGGRERRADLAAGVEGGGERVAHRGESRITRSLDHGTGYSIPARRPHALALRAATSCIVTTMVRRLACAALLLPVLAAAPGWSQIASPPQILGPLVGPGSIKPQPDLAFFGTDLGWTVEHQGQLRILFGDTDDVFNAVCFPQLHNDDSQGTMPLKRPDRGFRRSRCSPPRVNRTCCSV